MSESNLFWLLSCFTLIQPNEARLINGAHVRVPGFWSSPELDHFVRDKAAVGSLNRKGHRIYRPDCPPAGGNTQLTNGFWRSLPVAEFHTFRSMVVAGQYGAYDKFKACKLV